MRVPPKGRAAAAVAAVLLALGLLAAVDAVPASAAPCVTCGGGGGGGGGGSPVLPKMAVYSIQWTDFGGCVIRGDQQLCGVNTLRDGDQISRVETQGTPGLIRVTLQISPRITYYKEIKAYDSSGRTLGVVSTSGSSMTLQASQVAALVFTKGKFLNVHTGMYDLRPISTKAGLNETFSWDADSATP